jgi:hypothetical protein
MKKNIGFLALLLSIAGSLFYSDRNYDKKKSPFQPPARTGGGGPSIISHGNKPVYGRLPRKQFYQEKAAARKKRHEAMIWELKQEGIVWYNNKLYWATHLLSIQNS